MIINMGPQHPSTHGVLRLLLELDGETVITCKPIIGYLHTGIEKNTEYRTWMQGVTFVTRADYLSPFFNELGYCLAVERLLGVEAPPRAQVIRVLMNELNRISSHLVWLATGGLELGAVSVMLYGFREREVLMDIFEEVTGLRMNHAYIRIGGVIMDLPERASRGCDSFLRGDAQADRRLRDAARTRTRSGSSATWASGVLSAERRAGARRHRARCCARRASTPTCARTCPYCGYETYEFDVPVRTEADAYARYAIRLDEMRESMKIVRQCLERLEEPGPVMIEDPKVAWPAKLSVGPDGIGNDPAYLRHIMEESMEALIHHFKMVTQGVRGAARRGLPGGRVAPRRAGVLRGLRTANTSPTASKIRDPSFVNLQATPDDGGGLAGRRRDRRDRLARPGDGRGGPLMAVFEGGGARRGPNAIIGALPRGASRAPR